MPFPFLTRRDLLRAAGVGVAASAIPAIGTAGLRAPLAKTKAKSVVLLWMAGGVTHIDSFDPKPDAPEQIRGTLTAINVTVPGVRFSEVMPCLARQPHRLAVVRSYAHGNNDHFLSQAWALSGRK